MGDNYPRLLAVDPEAVALLQVLHVPDGRNENRQATGAAFAHSGAVVDPAPHLSS